MENRVVEIGTERTAATGLPRRVDARGVNQAARERATNRQRKTRGHCDL